jgi:hypothetical protein
MRRMQISAFALWVLTALSFQPFVHAQEQDDDFDRDEVHQPSLQVQTQSVQMPQGFELVTSQPQLIGHGFKAKNAEHTVALACVGAGTPASCGRIRHIITLKDSLHSYYFGPTYQVSHGEPSAAQIKTFSKEMNRDFKNYRFSRKARYYLYVVGGFVVLMTVPAVGGAGLIVWFVLANGNGEPILPGTGKIVSISNSDKVKWPKLSDRVFFKYINFVTGNAGTRLKAAIESQSQQQPTTDLSENPTENSPSMVSVKLYSVSDNGEILLGPSLN